MRKTILLVSVILVLALIGVNGCDSSSDDVEPNPPKYANNIAMAVDYLKSKYNPELQLIREAQGPGAWTFSPPWDKEWVVPPPWSGTKSYTMDKVFWLGDSAVTMMALQP